MASRTRIARIWRTLTYVEPVKPALTLGLRAGVAAVVPVIAARLLHAPSIAQVTFGGFLAALADKGGAYRTRAATMSAFGVAASLAASLGALAAGDPRIAVALAFVGIFAAAFARVYGDIAGSVGNLVAIVIAVALATPAHGIEDALGRGAALLGGSVWAMTLALVLWPVRPYRPVRVSVGACYRGLAEYAAFVARIAARAEEPSFAELLPKHAPLRASIEAARAAIATVRRGRQGESGRGERLLVLLQGADQLFGTLTALSEALEGGGQGGAFPRARAEAAVGLAAFAEAARAIATVTETEGRALEAPLVAWDARAVREAAQRDLSDARGEPDGAAHAQLLHAAELIGRLAEFAGVAAETAVTLDDDSPLEDAEASPPPSLRGEPPPRIERVLGPIRDNLTTRSLTLRHALRVGIAAAIAVAFGASLHLPRGYWITVTAVSILQPYAGATFQRGLQRIVGTVLGGLLAAGITAVVHDPNVLITVIFALAVAGVSLLPVNYGAFSALLTPTFVLLAAMSSGDFTLARVRVSSTLLGGALALACSALLWPSPERTRFPEQMAEALRVAGEVLERVALAGDEAEAEARIADARRRAGLAITNAEASFQRLVVESRGPAEALEPLMTLLTYARRFVWSVVALASSRAAEGEASRAEAARFAERVRVAIGEIALAVAERRAPSPLPELLAKGAPAGTSGAPGAPTPMTFRALRLAQIERVARQVEVLHGAATRVDPRSLSR